MKVRANESEKVWYRSERFFVVNGEWYFSTREQLDIGPFDSERAAQHGLELYIERVQSDNVTPEIAADIARNGEWSLTHYQ